MRPRPSAARGARPRPAAPLVGMLVGALAGLACAREYKREGPTFVEVRLPKILDGLSGLAIDADGALWTVAERGDRAYRITLTGPATAPRETHTELVIEGAPEGIDLEGIAVLGAGRFALGTEGNLAGTATVLLADQREDKLVVTGTVALPSGALGLELSPNNGAEGVCGAGDTILVGIEGVGEAEGKRWAPLVRAKGDAIERVHRLWLTSPEGKLSALDCTITPDGTITGWAIERHFQFTRVLAFTIPPEPGDVTPRLVYDLDPVIKGTMNLEGIAVLPDGRLATVVDNQWKVRQGPNRLLLFPAPPPAR